MARARNIKPSFFANEDLVELSFETRLLFIGLWTLADRAGRLEDRPKRIKMAIFPADSVDVDRALDDLAKSGFIERYEARGMRCIQVTNFSKHQNPHVNEKPSDLPTLDESRQAPEQHCASTVQAPEQHCGNPADSLIPDSLIPDSLYQSANSTGREGGATPEERSLDRNEPQAVTSQGAACLQMRAAGIQGLNTSHPKLLALLAAGVTPDEIGEVAREPKSKGKGMGWVLAVVEGRRRDAASAPAIPSGGARASPPRQPRTLSEGRAAAAKAIFSPGPLGADDGHERRTIDVSPAPSDGLGAKALR